MSKKPTYEELETRLRELESVVRFNSSNPLHDLMENLSALVCEFLPDSTLTYVNQSYCKFFGLTSEELIGRYFLDFIPVEKKEAVKNMYMSLTPQQPLKSYTHEVIRNGTVLWQEWTDRGIFNDQGKALRFCSIGFDITNRKRAEEEQESNSALLSIAGETAKFGGWSVDLRTNICTWSDTVADIHEMPRGYSPLIKDGISFYAPNFQKKITQVFMDCAQKGIPYNEEMEILTKTEKRVWVRTIGVAVRNESGEIVKVQGSFQNITERKNAEKVLQESVRRFEMAMLAVNDGLWDWTLTENKVYFDPLYYTMAGYEPNDFPHYFDEWKKRVHPEDIEYCLSAIKEHVSGKTNIFDLEFRFLKKDKTWMWIRCRGKIIERATNGKVLRMIGTHTDITAKKKAEDIQNRLTAAIEQSGEAIIITNPEGIIEYVNPAFEKVTAYSREEVLGQTPRILKSGKQDELFYRQLWSTLKKGGIFRGRIINKKKDGSLFTEDASISPVFDAGGKLINYLAVKRDITKHLQLQEQFQQAQKMESVGRLAGGVAHDFNNMLTIILNYTEMVMKEIDDPSMPIHNDLQQILKAAQKASEITRQLLAFARKQTIKPQVIDFNQTLEYMMKMLRRLMGEDIDLVWHPASSLWPVLADPTHIDQILANLCVNARDAISGIGEVTMETENITLDEVYCANRPGLFPGDYVLLTVSDNGHGMDRETVNHIFEPFFTTKEIGKGSGLGLSTVYGIVKQNNGFINVYSEPGKGTAFRIYLPRYTGDIDLSETHEMTAIPKGKNETILIVEDEPAILNLVRKLLEELGYKALEASTPGQAIEMAGTHNGKIHLLITDVVMPEMNGRTLSGRIQALCPELKVLFISGYTTDVIANQGILDTDVPFLQKPFSMKDFAIKVRGVLDDTA